MTEIFSQLPCTAVSVYAGSLREQHRGVIYKRSISSAPYASPGWESRAVLSCLTHHREEQGFGKQRGVGAGEHTGTRVCLHTRLLLTRLQSEDRPRFSYFSVTKKKKKKP